MRLSIVVPCYNEEKNIPLILEKFRAALNKEDLEVILVNNGSTDDSAKVLERHLLDYPFARTVSVPVNQGYGYGILKGLEAAEGDFIGWTHADLQTDPADVVKAYHLLEARNWDSRVYVKGNRKGRGLGDNFFTFGMSVFETIYLHQAMWDVNAQPNLFSRDFYDTWKNPPHDFALDLYALYMAQIQKREIVRFPVRFPPRLYGASHWNTGLASKWKFIKRTLSFSKRMKKEGII